MKKLLALFLILNVILLCSVGCSYNQGTDDGLLGNFYTVEVTGSTDHLHTPLMPFYKAGDVVEVKTHKITCVGLYVYVNGEEIPRIGDESDCLVFEFTMPSENVMIHITSDRFYGKDEFSFDELYFGLTSDLKYEINKVAVKTIDYSNKNNFVITKYSTKQGDIDNFKAIFNQKLIKVDHSSTADITTKTQYLFYSPGRDYYGEDYVTAFDPFTFYEGILNFATESDWQKFKFKDPNYLLPTIENPDLVTYSFQDSYLNDHIKKYGDDSFSKDYYNLEQVEFIPYEGSIDGLVAKFYLDTKFGIINMFNETIFEFGGQYYEIVEGERYWAYRHLTWEDKNN